MSIDGIIQRIEKDAAAETERIKQEYSAKIAELAHKFSDERKDALADAEKRAKIEREKAHKRAVDHAKLVMSQNILRKKMEILQKLFDEVEQHIKNLPPDRYRAYFVKILVELEQSEGEIVVAADKNVLDENFLHLASGKIEEKLGVKPNLSIKFVDEGWNGFYIQQHKVRYNVTLDAIMQSLREKMEGKVAKALFAE